MGQSGQTTEQRRELRLKQRALKSKIIEQELVSKGNEIFLSVSVCLSCVFLKA